jgi:uncharacterized damage-inducible protein DinB
MSTFKMTSMELARYNKWQNEVLLVLCDGLSDEELKQDRGAFFGGLLGTLNHILHVDRVLLEYIERGYPPDNFDPNATPFGDYPSLKEARLDLDTKIIEMMDTSPELWFDEVFSFFSDDLGRVRERPRALFISQMFNHQTHHRSQVTSMLHQLGIDYGSTDLPGNPLSQS